MKKPVAVIAIATLLALIGVVVFAVSGNQANSDNITELDTVASSNATGNTQPENSNTQAVESNNVEISNMAYQQSSITVKKGTTVTWTNRDSVQHDVMPDEQNDAFQGSELLSRGESYSFTFNTPGTYTYYCSPHQHMTGTVIVTE